jgi:hypothetical protein
MLLGRYPHLLQKQRSALAAPLARFGYPASRPTQSAPNAIGRRLRSNTSATSSRLKVYGWTLARPPGRRLGGLRQFLGLTNYFRKFIPCHSSVVASLTDLTKKDAFFGRDTWIPPCQAAFETIKRSVTDDIVLHFPDSNSPFRVEVFSDASLDGTGAVLLQGGQPIAYASK